ncbi:hydroxymethylglutaryl-CoA lyase [Polynucleobacter sp. AP-Melu-500A-A1]|uniref:hydroxymethylglutaryl-CoA lyase n=1 Tax=Polynucleobacter sp. AP-Melu-500A-A1 TaxID=2576929 RepID=UPI001C0D3348|nr:hydroxymethylglutaryl-CoA lyase [Polynucleobacter sp. AP-Melu-500A-A1]MBU3630828.1 hydroxymethylglutaryl-CoA lyase [Polynucleobacter sp. AP-Melu-500A-A1]
MTIDSASIARKRLYIQEVVTRDGFQAENSFIPTEEKIALINRLSRAGYAKIEVSSFTSPKAIPMLADAEAVMKGIERVPGVEYTVLIPNLKGAERAISVGVDEFNLVMSVSEVHNKANLKMAREDSFIALSSVIDLAHANKIPTNISLSTSFGCPMSGIISLDDLMNWIDRFAAVGVRGITICDTTGMANPAQVQAVCEAAQSKYPHLQWTLHFHNTRGMGLANALAAVNSGIDRFDSSLGGLGGCPYAPGATGNICTEEMVHMFDLMGFDTQIDIDALLACSKDLQSLIGRPLPSQLLMAGKVDKLHTAPCQP